MTIDEQIRDAKNMMLIEKQQKYQPYHQAKLISMNILQVKKYYLLIIIIEQTKFTYSTLGNKNN